MFLLSYSLVTQIGREKCTCLTTLPYTGHRGVAETTSASHLMWECTPITLCSVVPLTRLWIHLERGRCWTWADATRTFCARFSRLSASCYNHTQLTLSGWVSVLVPLLPSDWSMFEYGREWVRILCPSILEGRSNISVFILINSHERCLQAWHWYTFLKTYGCMMESLVVRSIGSRRRCVH